MQCGARSRSRSRNAPRPRTRPIAPPRCGARRAACRRVLSGRNPLRWLGRVRAETAAQLAFQPARYARHRREDRVRGGGGCSLRNTPARIAVAHGPGKLRPPCRARRRTPRPFLRLGADNGSAFQAAGEQQPLRRARLGTYLLDRIRDIGHNLRQRRFARRVDARCPGTLKRLVVATGNDSADEHRNVRQSLAPQ